MSDDGEESDDVGEEKKIIVKRGNEIAGTLTPGLKYCSGKSRLFPMKPYSLIEKIKLYPITVTFYWKPTGGMAMSYIGDTDIMLGKEFMDCVANVDGPVPLSVNTEEKYTVRNEKREITGFVKIFVRMTCFGKAHYHISEC
ncbi:hypothetical protein O3M35_012921 [Rhynocoris fuscipes]|uniref:Uncharacterized protein n=1 Tax=Rhynocoris fuscipes TaxID=488301 RepID=A0AAW1CJA0_9HEMI